MHPRLTATVITFALAALAVPAWASSGMLFRLADPRLDEASGIARGIASPGVYYVQNDSGDPARFFAVDARSGRTRAVFIVPGARDHDWEDIAVAPDARGVSSLWIADIGDNDAARSDVQIYRIDEPQVDDGSQRTGAPDVWRLRYPGGPANAESLAVSPQGRAYIVTKVPSGHSSVYEVPPRPDADQVQPLTRIGAMTLHAHPSIVPRAYQVLATGAALSTDGSVFAVRTYSDAYLWRVRGGDLAAALRTAPTRVVLPLQPQGEGICIVDSDLVIDSEHAHSEVYNVPLPQSYLPVWPGRTSQAPTPAPTPRSTTLPSHIVSSAPTSAGSHAPTRSSRTGMVALGAAAIAALGATVIYVRWRRTRG